MKERKKTRVNDRRRKMGDAERKTEIERGRKRENECEVQERNEEENKR